ncbi:hypothetical protein NOS3756_43020 [Nostoc sp. NIES-3756]|uniref:hypothetical protein n=1 Tax=Nostoc sp. NIES-3756 TaxID=1751286 RepID=UPI0007210C8E|nr:hypothetical protein [Nostoc sp. NIES-3756]BAT55323.1 hypothetical protein NOS3756_43020 [Nostoc sp. NIES-3756]
MSKIIISDSPCNRINTFIQKLTPEEADTILGGMYPYGFKIINITDSVSINTVGGDNTVEAGTNSISYHDNKIHTIDYSRSNINRFY